MLKPTESAEFVEPSIEGSIAGDMPIPTAFAPYAGSTRRSRRVATTASELKLELGQACEGIGMSCRGRGVPASTAPLRAIKHREAHTAYGIILKRWTDAKMVTVEQARNRAAGQVVPCMALSMEIKTSPLAWALERPLQ